MRISTQFHNGKLQHIPEMKFRFTPILFRELPKTSVSLSD